ncbi:MAG: radical SAM protein [Methanobacteriota archaeon]|nr:MAG: radical SAM protein [Euryarchaeota archaeon]
MFLRFGQAREAACNVCNSRSKDISATLGVCRKCIIERWEEAREWAEKAHRESREDFSLPVHPPKEGKACGKCVNDCRIPEGEKGFCGVRGNLDGKVVSLVEGAIVEWYYDHLPTNCVGAFACPGCSRVGYPKYSHAEGVEHGFKNLAVFYGACTFDCLFCQNWSYRGNSAELSPVMSPQELASKADDKTPCICYFGGDPTPQIDHAIETAEIATQRGGITRICFETNGSMTKPSLRKIAEIVYDSGGCIKFDLKTWHEELNYALCATTNKQTQANFKWLVEYGEKRGDRGIPFLVASTLLVPGYINDEEVGKISEFLAGLDEKIPYSLLGFHPDFRMMDMRTTRKEHAYGCLEIAKESGLKNVNIGNIHLLQ